LIEHDADAVALAAMVQEGEISAAQAVGAAIDRSKAIGSELNCFTEMFEETAMAEASRIDALVRAGRPAGPLAGVPFAVKNLFDVTGAVTLAGSRIDKEKPPAAKDATAVRRLREAGAILIGALGMAEYAYGFTSENTHFGPVGNPHDKNRTAGGSSSGSAAIVGSGCLPFSLGTDTNGSVRVPASLCGTFGLKPTYGRVSRAGVTPFTPSLDHVGFFTRSVRDAAVCTT
jgi:1-carboxybiuret hydrolase